MRTDVDNKDGHYYVRIRIPHGEFQRLKTYEDFKIMMLTEFMPAFRNMLGEKMEADNDTP